MIHARAAAVKNIKNAVGDNAEDGLSDGSALR